MPPTPSTRRHAGQGGSGRQGRRAEAEAAAIGSPRLSSEEGDRDGCCPGTTRRRRRTWTAAARRRSRRRRWRSGGRGGQGGLGDAADANDPRGAERRRAARRVRKSGRRDDAAGGPGIMASDHGDRWCRGDRRERRVAIDDIVLYHPLVLTTMGSRMAQHLKLPKTTTSQKPRFDLIARKLQPREHSARQTRGEGARRMSTASAGSSGSLYRSAAWVREDGSPSSPGRRRVSTCAGKLSQRKTRGYRGLSVVAEQHGTSLEDARARSPRTCKGSGVHLELQETPTGRGLVATARRAGRRPHHRPVAQPFTSSRTGTPTATTCACWACTCWTTATRTGT